MGLIYLKTESNQSKSHTREIYNDAYNKIENYLSFSSRFIPDVSGAKLSYKLIILLKTFLVKMGFKVEYDQLWEKFFWCYYEAHSKNTAVGSTLGTMFYGLTEPQKLDLVYDMLADEASKAVFDWFLQYRFAYLAVGPIAAAIFPNLNFDRRQHLTFINKKGNFCRINDYLIDYGHDWNEVENTWLNEQYLLTGRCEPKKGEMVIDAGGFQGGTAIWFADQVGQMGKVYSFEPLPGNFQKMQQNIHRNNLEGQIETVNQGLWNNCTDLLITNKDSISVCSPDHGDLEIKVITLDSYVQTNCLERVDFIKMDIEGAELPALKGARQTIVKFKPKLAISVYHLPGDIYEIPFYLKSLIPEYRLYLSHKFNGWHETILFAAAD